MATFEEMQRYAREVAAPKYGIDPATFVRGLGYEGLAPNSPWQSAIYKDGVREPSYGPGQLFTGGGLGNKFQEEYPNLDITDPETYRENLDFTARNVAQSGWPQWHGPTKRGGFSRWQGIRDGAPVGTPTAGGAPAPGGSNMGLMDVFNGQQPPVTGGQEPPGFMDKFNQGLNSPLTAMGLGLLSRGPTVVGRGPTGIGAGLSRGYQMAQNNARAQSALALKEREMLVRQEEAKRDNIYRRVQMQGLVDAQADRKTAARRETDSLRGSAELGANAANQALKAIDALSATPAAAQFAYMDPETRASLQQGIASVKAGEGNPSILNRVKTWAAQQGLDAANVTDLDKASQYLADAARIDKYRGTISAELGNLISSGQGGGTATALKNRLDSLGQNAPLEVQREVFDEARKLIAGRATAEGFELPPPYQRPEIPAQTPTGAPGPQTSVTPPGAPQAAPGLMDAVAGGADYLRNGVRGLMDASAPVANDASAAAQDALGQLPQVFSAANIASTVEKIKSVPGMVEQFSQRAMQVPLEFTSEGDASSLATSGALAPGKYQVKIDGRTQIMTVEA